ncbi:MAG: hypothetical protein KKH44_03175 [Bacteroidetes bacterium]|nr:hypothetical protein [Bacteroidota bacterium]
MITLGLLKTELRSFLVNTSLTSRITDWAYWVHTDILSMTYKFWWNNKTSSLATVDGTAEYFLNYRCNADQLTQMIDTSNNNELIIKCDIETIYGTSDYSTDEGEPLNWALVGLYGVQAISTSDDVATVVSSSASDLSISCVIHGQVSGIETTEEISLNGTTPVVGTTTWDEGTVWQVTLGSVPFGNITVTIDTDTIVVIPAGQYRIQCPKIRLWRIPGDVRTINYTYQKNPIKVTNSNDVIDLPDHAFECLMKGVMYWGHLNNGDVDYAENTMKPAYEKAKKKLIELADARNFRQKDFLEQDGAVFTLPRTITYVVT